MGWEQKPPTKSMNLDLDAALDKLPDDVADALETWRIATLDREKCEALLFAAIKGTNDKMTAAEIKARINSDGNRYAAVLEEIKAESAYQRLSERLMAVKKRASLRTAF